MVNVGCMEDDTKRYDDPVGISIRKGKEFEPIPRCQYCKNGIPHNRWRVINRVKRKGKGYDVKQIHIFHAKLALSEDEFQLLLRLLKSSSDTETNNTDQPGYNLCTREWEKELKREQQGGVVTNGLNL